MNHEQKMEALRQAIDVLPCPLHLRPEDQWRKEKYTNDIIDLVDVIFDNEPESEEGA